MKTKQGMPAQEQQDDTAAVKRVKNIAAILYVLAMGFLVVGSYLHQPS